VIGPDANAGAAEEVGDLWLSHATCDSPYGAAKQHHAGLPAPHLLLTHLQFWRLFSKSSQLDARHGAEQCLWRGGVGAQAVSSALHAIVSK